MYKIHTSPELVKEQYNLIGIIGGQIFDNLIDIIPKPKCRVTIQLQINSLALDAVTDIKLAIDEFTKITQHSFKVSSAPIYTCEFISDYNQLGQLNLLVNPQVGEIDKCIANFKVDKLYIKNMGTSVKIIEV